MRRFVSSIGVLLSGASACKCDYEGLPEWKRNDRILADSKRVFVGKVIAKKEYDQIGTLLNSEFGAGGRRLRELPEMGYNWKIDFEVELAWRGVDSKVMTISVGNQYNCATGPSKFEMGQLYTISTVDDWHQECNAVSLRMAPGEISKVIGKPKKPAAGNANKDKRRKLQIRYRAVRSFKKTMQRTVKLAKKFMARSGQDLDPRQKAMQDQVTKAVIKQMKRVSKIANKQEKKRFKRLTKISKKYSLQAKENSKVDFRGKAGKKSTTYQPEKDFWPNLVGKDVEEAHKIIKVECGCNVIQVPEGASVIENYDLDRVWLYYNERTKKVASAPRRG